jgi:hypothetical protein
VLPGDAWVGPWTKQSAGGVVFFPTPSSMERTTAIHVLKRTFIVRRSVSMMVTGRRTILVFGIEGMDALNLKAG